MHDFISWGTTSYLENRQFEDCEAELKALKAQQTAKKDAQTAMARRHPLIENARSLAYDIELIDDLGDVSGHAARTAGFTDNESAKRPVRAVDGESAKCPARVADGVTSLAVLTDTDPKWRPNKFCRQGFGCNLEFTFPIAKLTDFRERMDELETSSNPFAAFVWAHILTQDSSRDPELLVPFKVRYTRSLYRRGFNREQILTQYEKRIKWHIFLP